MDYCAVDYGTLRSELDARRVSCKELTQTFLQKIEAKRDLNAFITVFDDAVKRAEEVDRRLAEGRAGRLAGLVLAVKDIIVMKGAPTTCGSRILADFYAPYNATVIEKLAAEDVIFIGKTNMDEFGMGSSNETSAFGPVRHPLDAERVPGGSSGGSAAAVAGGLCTAALGSDTGGSIRQPASFCGIVGLKPTYGRVSRFGLVAYGSSLDQIGPLTRSVADAALLLSVIAGHDQLDSTSAALPVEDYTAYRGRGVAGLKIGLPKEYFQGLDPQVERPLREQIEKLKAGGAEFVDVSLPHTEYAVATYYIIATAEASSNLARYDGARYGRRAEAGDLEEMYVNSRTEGFGAEVKRRIMLGTYVLSSGYYDAYYRKAQQVRTLIRRDFENAFQQVDCLLTPAAPHSAFKIGEKIDDPLTMYLSDIYTVSCNLAGLPGLCLPAGTDSYGLPVGVQLLAAPFSEGRLIQVGDYLENSR